MKKIICALNVITLVSVMYVYQTRAFQSGLASFINDLSVNQNWKHLSIIGNDDDEFFPKSDSIELFKSLSGNLSNVYIRFVDKNEIGEVKPVHRQQFICLWHESFVDIFERAGEMKYFVEFQEWFIILGRNSTIEDIEDSINHVPIYIESDVFLLKFNYAESKWIIFEIWRIGPKWENFETREIGEWKKDFGLMMENRRTKYLRRRDMKGYPIRVMTETYPSPFTTIIPNATEEEENRTSGICNDIFFDLKDQLNFTYISYALDGWKEMINSLPKDKVDILVGPTSFTVSRYEIIDYLLPFQYDEYVLYIRRPEIQASWDLYSLPYHYSMWFFIPTFGVLTAVALWIFGRIPVYFKYPGEDLTLASSLWVVMNFMLQQGVTFEPKQSSTRILFIFTYITLMILLISYSAILVSIITTMKAKLPFQTFEELRDMPGWSVATIKDTATFTFMEESPKGSAIQAAFEHKLMNNFSGDLDEGLRMTLKGDIAFFSIKGVAEQILYKTMAFAESSKIISTDVSFHKAQLAFAVQNDSPFLKIWNKYLSKMKSSGVLNRLKKKYWVEISREPASSYPSSGLNEIFTVFFYLAVGMIFALISLGVEWKVKNRKTKVHRL